jgi:hypothetical protein
VPTLDFGGGRKRRVFAGSFLDAQFEVEGWAADAPGFAVGFAGFGVEA